MSIRNLFEAKGDYKVLNGTYTEAVQQITKYANDMGYMLDSSEDPEDAGAQMFDVVGSGPRKPKDGVTNKFSFELYKGEKKNKKMLHAQITGVGTKYELNIYIN